MTSSIDSASLLLGHIEIPIWLGLAIEEMTERADVSVTDVTVATPPRETETGVKRFLQESVITAQNQVILSNLDREVDVRLLPSVSADAVRWCDADRVGTNGAMLPDQTEERIASTADVVVHHSVGILKGELIRNPEPIVLGYHHGDIREYRGPGYGFWEFINDEPTSGVTLQILDEELDSGRIVELVTIDIRGADTLSEVRKRINAASIPLLATGIQDLGDPEFSPTELSQDELGEMYYYSDTTPAVKLRYFAKECLARIARI